MATYYVDATSGSDSANGTSDSTPWKTIAKVNGSSFSAGDSILFKKGETWREQLTVPSAGSAGNPITFGAYGTGNNPKIYGSTVPESWTSESFGGAETPTLIQEKSGSNASAAVSVVLDSAPTAGHLLVAVGKGTTAIDNASITGWTVATSAVVASPTTIAIFYKVAEGTESATVTLNWTSSTFTILYVSQYSGMSSSPLDKVANASTASGVASQTSGTTAATTVDDELVIAGIGTGNGVTSQSWSNSFTEEAALLGGNLTFFAASKIVSSTGAQETTLSWTTNRYAGGVISTFKAATGEATQLYYSSQTTEPMTIWFIATNGTINWGNKKTTKESLAAEYDWWFDDPNNRIYVVAATSPATRYTSVEVSLDTGRGIWVDTAHTYQYINVDSFEVAFISGNGIVLKANSNITNCTAHHIGLDSATHANGVELNPGLNGTMSGNTVYEVKNAGIYMVGYYDPYTVDNVIIENNTVYDYYTYGIFCYAETNTTALQNITVRKNHVYHNSTHTPNTSNYAIYFFGKAAAAADNITIAYNVIDSNKGILIGNYSTDTIIYNNTIKVNIGAGIVTGTTGNSGTIIKNNIVISSGTYGIIVVDINTISAIDYNLWYGSGATAYVLVEATAYHSDDFTAYKTDTGWDAHGLWQDPVLVSTTDFRLQSSSPCINAGTDVGLTTDYAGNIVPKGALPDIGAYEWFVPIVSHDMQILDNMQH